MYRDEVPDLVINSFELYWSSKRMPSYLQTGGTGLRSQSGFIIYYAGGCIAMTNLYTRLESA